MKILIAGCGDLGVRVATKYLADGAAVIGLVRSADSAARLARAGIAPWIADLDAPPVQLPGNTFDLVHHFAPPPRTGTTDPRTAALLAAIPHCGRLLYVSTTAVYGDHGGAWIDELTPPAPGTDRGRRRLDAETQVRTWGASIGTETIVLRVAAIWGPGRGGREPPRTPSGTPTPVNRIHVDDLAEVCIAAAARAPDGAVYDCADGAPTETGRMDESKRVRAQRIRDELGVTPRVAAQP
ncbi:MAG: NAD-dependent epimerase/dehydratase family protein [Gammaproteobacteria bacterium]